MALALISVRDVLDSARIEKCFSPMPKTDAEDEKGWGSFFAAGIDSLTRVASPSIPTKEPENKSPGVEV